MTTLALAAENFINIKGDSVALAFQNVQTLTIQDQWVGFLDGLSVMESAGAGGYDASNGTFVGMYQFGNDLLNTMHFYAGIGGLLLGVTNLADYS